MRWTYLYTSVLLMELNFHLYGPTNEGLAVPKQSADICHFYEKGIILMCMTSESPLQGHVFSSVLIPPLLIKIGELKKVCISLWIKHIFELAWSKMFSDVLRPFSRRSTVFYRSPSGSTQNMWEGLGKPGMEWPPYVHWLLVYFLICSGWFPLKYHLTDVL